MLFDVLERPIFRHHHQVVLPILIRQGRRIKCLVRPPNQLFQPPIHDLAEPLIREDKPPLLVLAKDADRQCFDQRSIHLLRFPQLRFGPFSLDGKPNRLLQDRRRQPLSDQDVLSPRA